MGSMFKSANFKLTLFYILILATISLFFSFNWLGVATAELDRQLEQTERIQSRTGQVQRGRAELQALLTEQAEQIESAKNTIKFRIIAANVLLLSIGGLGSYILAKKTLQPIEVAHRRQSRFTADASHELKTPLASMRAEIEVALRDKSASKQSYKAILSSNIEELDKLQNLSESLLRLANQDKNIPLTILDPKESVQTILKRHTIHANEKNITIIDETTHEPVIGHESSFEELVSILVENAIKYSDKDDSVTIRTKRGRLSTTISIIDTGVGIEKKDLKRIFDRFYRAEKSRTSKGKSGHGLGLSIAEDLAQLQNSCLTVKSVINEGSTFSFSLKNAS